MGDRYYGINIAYFKFNGFWQFLIGGVGRSKTVMCSMGVGCCFAAYIIVQLVTIAVSNNDFAIFTEKLTVSLTFVESLVKMLFYCSKRESLLELLDLFRTNLLSSANHSPVTSNEILSNSAKLVNSTARWFFIILVVTGLVWAVFPLLLCFSAAGCSKLQPFPSWYPGDVTHFPLNALVYLFELTLILYIITLLHTVNCIFSALSLTASAQLELLSSNFTSIEENAILAIQESQYKITKQDAMYKLLRDCLIDHQHLLRLLNQMEDVFNPIFLFQMLISTFTICLAFVQLNVHRGSSDGLPLLFVFKFFTYLIFGSAEVFIYSWGGQLIHDKSGEIYWSLQRSGWHEGSQAFKTNVLIALIRSRSPVSLTAGKFYDVNFASFIQVIKGSYSYFTFLHQSQSLKK